MIGGRQPRDPAALGPLDLVGDDLRAGGDGGHQRLSSPDSSSSRSCAASSSAVVELLRLALAPGLPVVERQPDHAGEHVGVVAPAQLGALALVDHAVLTLGDRVERDPEPGLVRVAGHAVRLAAELGDPPRVHDVLGLDVERHGHADRHVHVVVGVHALLTLDVGIDEAPRILLADHADVEEITGRRGLVGGGVPGVRGNRVALGVDLGRGGVLDVVEQEEREHGEEDEDRRSADRPADLELRVAVDLRRDAPLARAELDQRVDQQALDPDEDHEADRRDQDVERPDRVGVGRAVGLRQEPAGGRGGGEHQRPDDHGGQDCPHPEQAAPGLVRDWSHGVGSIWTGGREAARHRPANAAGRFSRNARTPSSKSPDAADCCWIDASSSSCSPMRANSQALNCCLIPA